MLRARFTTLVREAAKVMKAGKEGASRVVHESQSGLTGWTCQPRTLTSVTGRPSFVRARGAVPGE